MAWAMMWSALNEACVLGGVAVRSDTSDETKAVVKAVKRMPPHFSLRANRFCGGAGLTG